jgi:2-polyprenyl-3-methyl-5-hydroxy-6-metoxy-1,4-benzoquinol methylase
MKALPDYYDRGIKENPFQFYWHEERFRLIRGFLPKIKSRVLDIGCHGGTLTAVMAEVLPKAKFWGVDADRAAITYAQKKRPGIDFQVASAEKLPFEDGYFDMITCFDLIEHVAEPRVVLGEARRCLKKNGWLLIWVNTEAWQFRLAWYFWLKTRGRVWQETHLHHFRAKELEDLIEAQGFKIDKKILTHLGMMKLVRASL